MLATTPSSMRCAEKCQTCVRSMCSGSLKIENLRVWDNRHDYSTYSCTVTYWKLDKALYDHFSQHGSV